MSSKVSRRTFFRGAAAGLLAGVALVYCPKVLESSRTQWRVASFDSTGFTLDYRVVDGRLESTFGGWLPRQDSR